MHTEHPSSHSPSRHIAPILICTTVILFLIAVLLPHIPSSLSPLSPRFSKAIEPLPYPEFPSPPLVPLVEPPVRAFAARTLHLIPADRLAASFLAAHFFHIRCQLFSAFPSVSVARSVTSFQTIATRPTDIALLISRRVTPSTHLPILRIWRDARPAALLGILHAGYITLPNSASSSLDFLLSMRAQNPNATLIPPAPRVSRRCDVAALAGECACSQMRHASRLRRQRWTTARTQGNSYEGMSKLPRGQVGERMLRESRIVVMDCTEQWRVGSALQAGAVPVVVGCARRGLVGVARMVDEAVVELSNEQELRTFEEEIRKKPERLEDFQAKGAWLWREFLTETARNVSAAVIAADTQRFNEAQRRRR